MLTISTDRYQTHRAEHGAGVRTTAGAPRFKLKYALAANLSLVAPDRAMFALSEDAFAEAYLGKLDSVGFDVILAALEQIASDAGTDRICLMCFCADRSTCHRRLLADWLTEHGIATDEHATSARPTF